MKYMSQKMNLILRKSIL